MKKLIGLGLFGILLSVIPIASQAEDCDTLSNTINSGINTKTVSQQCSLIRAKSQSILDCAADEKNNFVFSSSVAQATIAVCNFYKENPENFYTQICKNVIVTPSGTPGSNGNPSSSECFIASVNFMGAPKKCKDAFDAISKGVESGNTVLEQCNNVIKPNYSAISSSECTSISIPFSEQMAGDIKKLCDYYIMNPDSERTKKCGGLKVSFDNNSEAAKCNRDSLSWIDSCAGQGGRGIMKKR